MDVVQYSELIFQILITTPKEEKRLRQIPNDKTIYGISDCEAQVTVETDNPGNRGNWSPLVRCLPGSYIHAVRIKYDEYSGDDAIGVSQLQIFCSFPNGYEANNMVIGVSDYEPDGTWLPYQRCPSGTWIKAWDQSVMPFAGPFADNDALNNLVFHCSADVNGRLGLGTTLEGTGDARYPPSSAECPFSMVACGVQTRVQKDQGTKDDTAMNHIQFECCFMDL
nr:vitelline membrane outer layer protein 1 homolog [Penaeus vannamei]